MQVLAGVDIGGTKCAVCVAAPGEPPRLLEKRKIPTPATPNAALHTLVTLLEELCSAHPDWKLIAIGISCGGPLDGARGLISGPPNLPGWNRVDCFTPFRAKFKVPIALQNDADACALAEWHWGAGQGCQSMIFLTFGTGMGAGLILGGKLYVGASNLAGEAGHIRLAARGPVGYGKPGSFEGFCSGGGIAALGRAMASRALNEGRVPAFCPSLTSLDSINAQKIGIAAQNGDLLAQKIMRISGQHLGKALAILIDLLNPERIVIGSIYARQQALLEPAMRQALRLECLPDAYNACRILPAQLDETIGDYASLSVARHALQSDT